MPLKQSFRMISCCVDFPRGPSESAFRPKVRFFLTSTFTGAPSKMTSHRIPPRAGADWLHKACWENRACVCVCVFSVSVCELVAVFPLGVRSGLKTHTPAGKQVLKSFILQ